MQSRRLVQTEIRSIQDRRVAGDIKERQHGIRLLSIYIFLQRRSF